MKQLKYIVLILILNTLCFFLHADTAEAKGQTLRVSPVIITLSLSPGKTSSQEATIENLTDTPLPLRATLNDFITSGEEGGYVFADTKENPLLSWIKLNETEFLLGPKEKKTIQLTITTPQSIPLGGYYGILFFEPVLQTTSLEATRVSTKVGILMLATIGVPNANAKPAEILTFSTDLFQPSGTIPLLLRVKNISLNYFTAKPIVTITPLIPFSSSVKPVYLEEKIIFPGKVRRWTENSTIQNIPSNIYKVTVAVSSGQGQAVTQETYVVVFPYMQALIILLLFLLVLAILKKRKRFKKAVSALFRP